MNVSHFDPIKIRSTIKWYFESKNVSLRKALQIRGPLSTDQHNDLRVFYSQYVTSLVSAVEALLEKEYPFSEHFPGLLYREFVIGDYSDGEQNYAYLKELRNSVVHRGEDIAGRGSLTPAGLHLLHVPPKMSTRNGKATYQAFSPLLLGIAALCESLIGRLILRHFEENDLLQPRTDYEAWVAHMQAHVESDPSIPDFVKQQLPNVLKSVDLQKVEEQDLASLVRLLSSEHKELVEALRELQEGISHV
jgi:hypothetical protein